MEASGYAWRYFQTVLGDSDECGGCGKQIRDGYQGTNGKREYMVLCVDCRNDLGNRVICPVCGELVIHGMAFSTNGMCEDCFVEKHGIPF